MKSANSRIAYSVPRIANEMKSQYAIRTTQYEIQNINLRIWYG